METRQPKNTKNAKHGFGISQPSQIVPPSLVLSSALVLAASGNPSWQFILGSNVFCLSWKLVCFRISVEQQQLIHIQRWLYEKLFTYFGVTLIFKLLTYRFLDYAIFWVKKYPNFSDYSWIIFIKFGWNCLVVSYYFFSEHP